MAIEIKNLKAGRPTKPYDVRVDRGTPLGNPFHMRYEYQRDAVCDKYAEHFHTTLKYESAACAELERLLAIYKQYGILRLYCWCAPKRCHAETIKNCILDRSHY